MNRERINRSSVKKPKIQPTKSVKFANTCETKFKTNNINYLCYTNKTDVDVEMLPPALVATNLSSNVITVPANCLKTDVSIFIDTGASANVVNLNTLEKLRSKVKSVLVFEPPDSKLIGLDNNPFRVIGKVNLPISFKRGNIPISIPFHVTDNLKFPADLLLGIGGMIELEILVYPNRNGIIHNNEFIEGISPSRPILLPYSYLQATLNATSITQNKIDRSSVLTTPIKQTFDKDSNQISPIDSNQISPIDSNQISPIDSNQISPVDSNQISPVDSKQISPITYNVTERSILTTPHNNANVHEQTQTKCSFSTTKEANQIKTNTNPSNKISNSDSRIPFSNSQKLSIQRDLNTMTYGTLVGDALLGGHESVLVCLKLAGVNEICEAISLNETERVANIFLESALCSVDKNGYTYIFIHNNSPTERKIREGTNLVDFAVLPVRIGAIANLPILPHEETESQHKEKIQQELSEMLKHSAHPHAHSQLIDILLQTHNTIAIEGDKLGSTNLITHHIPVKPNTEPIYIPAYRFPHSKRKILDNIIEDMLLADVIEASDSPWNFPLFLVPKKNGEWRPVVDYRRLNKVCEKTRFPLPILKDILMSIGEDNKVFTTLDLLSGYHQVPLDTESKKYTSFSTPTGKYAYKKLPMGCSGAPLAFQRLVNTIFKGVLGTYVHVFMDDILICSPDVKTHLKHIQEVFSRLHDAGLKVKLSKCKFLKERLIFLGHVLDGNGVHTSQDKISSILKYPTPVDVKTLQSFLGLAGFYRSFIKDYSKIAKPLTHLLKKDEEFNWGNDQEKAFLSLKEKLSSTPVLAYPNFNNPFYVYTDASGVGLGAVLMQKDCRGKLRPLAFASRVLNKAERNYSTTHREALACVWALKHFKDIIYGYDILVRTDHAPVVELFNSKELSGKLARWRLTVIDFNPKFEYLPGTANVVADSLSRNFVASLQEENTLDNIAQLQRADPYCNSLIYYIESGDETHIPNIPIPISEFRIDNNILVRDTHLTLQHEPKRQVTQVVIPKSLIPNILHKIHDSPQGGHPGKEKCLHQAKLNYYWHTMRIDIHNHIDICQSCAEHKGNTGKIVPILNYPVPKAPWETLAIDLLKLPLTENQYQYLLVCIDHFSRFSILVPLKDKTAKGVAKALIDEVFCKFNTPLNIISDNGSEFNNDILNEICKNYNINKINIVAYHPASNGLVERHNRKIIQILKHLNDPPSFTWDEWIHQVSATLNCSIHKSINEIPHFVVFGQDKRLPYSILSSKSEPLYNPDNYAQLRLIDFQNIYKRVTESLLQSKDEMIKYNTQITKNKDINLGQIVFAKIHDTHSKLDAQFEGPYRVTQLLKGNKIQITHLRDSNKTQIIHKDHIKLVSDKHANTHEKSIEIDNINTKINTENNIEQIQIPEYKQKLRSYRQPT